MNTTTNQPRLVRVFSRVEGYPVELQAINRAANGDYYVELGGELYAPRTVHVPADRAPALTARPIDWMRAVNVATS